MDEVTIQAALLGEPVIPDDHDDLRQHPSQFILQARA
jgi:hypothetical protein